MSPCKGETADLGLRNSAFEFPGLNRISQRQFWFCWLPWQFFLTWGVNIQRQIPNGISAPLRGETRRSTPQLHPFSCISRVNPELCFAGLPLGHLSSSIPDTLLHAWEVSWPILPTWSTFFFFSQTSFTSSHTGFAAHSAVPTGRSAAVLIFLGVFP